mmetsp:Transcript_129760/g.361487  ORF Transcript_129760/g.361487 Transcript_129760/m.361487 type:complete len:473 (+) Transcript_129760:58-1476(+)|eukprot:CAMPEP_0179072518 /NCGR_PEP_ID=MMETSP0796-20121207/32097_1 /TAXON_ID=73915 /ORGANISM="Pyrodinium bahamense, Strain pbaha01" /LENGTH=472 /DNA_ID=CAMNT_0020769683 /DNA_START=58 /DNA_END=1476 /DNA_ORIENTATION=+
MASRSVSNLLKKHRYTEIKMIGEGSFGQAHLVQAENGAKLVCKMIDVSQASAKETQDTLKEARLLASFQHPFIVQYASSFMDSGWLCILMAFCEGGDLTSQIEEARKARRYIEEKQVLRWMAQALLALQYIHGRHVLHRDLKSSNFFLSRSKNLKMGDFGIAKVLTCTQAVARTQIGTPYYFSPEVCMDKPYGWPSDIWAMGVILYELCALKFPFDGGDNMVLLVQSICRGTATPLPEGYSEFVRHLCNEMLNKNPSLRPSAGVILSRPQIQCIVQQFFEEAKAIASQGQAPEPAASSAGDATGTYKKGDLVEYYSNSHKSWLPAIISSVDGQGSVAVDLKPNSWIPPEQQAQQLRPRRALQACSTQVLDTMLQEGEGERQPPGPPVEACPPPPGAPGDAAEGRTAVPAENKVGIGASDEEFMRIMDELCPDEASGDAGPSALPGIGEADALTGSLTQAEIDMLNSSFSKAP